MRVSSSRWLSYRWCIFLTLTMLTFLPLVSLGYFSFFPFYPNAKESVILQVYKGQTGREVSRILKMHQLISNERIFFWLGKIYGHWPKLKAGEYKLAPSMSALQLFSVLTSGISVAYPITVPEGENIYEIARNLESHQLSEASYFVKLCKDPVFIQSFKRFSNPPTSLEGYLAPDTYLLNKKMLPQEIIKQMVKHFFENWKSDYETRLKELSMTQHMLVTLASIIEKETGAPEERALISSVFHNRLKKKMRLQSDPTTIYGIWEHYHGKIHKKDLLEKNEYNTYMIDSLPIGPIANPGAEAIQAALYPATSSYLYFVSHNDGTHQFSKTLEEHNQAVQKFQLDPQARIGKSWRNRVPANHTPETKSP